MPETPTFHLPYPARTDRADIQLDLQELAVTLDEALVHDHDDRYWTEAEADARYAALTHTHDDRYYTETEADARFAPIGGGGGGLTEAAADLRYGRLAIANTWTGIQTAGLAVIGTHPTHGMAGFWKAGGAADNYALMADGTSLYLNADNATSGQTYFRKGNADMMKLRSDSSLIVGNGSYEPVSVGYSQIIHGANVLNYNGAWAGNIVLTAENFCAIQFHDSGARLDSIRSEAETSSSVTTSVGAARSFCVPAG